MADGNLVFAGLGKFGPIADDGRVEVKLALVDEAMRADRSKPFGRGEDVDDGVAVPRTRAGLVGVAGPEVDDLFAIDGNRDGGAVLVTLFEILGKSRFDALEARVAGSF